HTRLCSIRPPTPPIDALSLHAALPISSCHAVVPAHLRPSGARHGPICFDPRLVRKQTVVTSPALPAVLVTGVSSGIGLGITKKLDRKSTRLNSSHVKISYAVFCLKKKK